MAAPVLVTPRFALAIMIIVAETENGRRSGIADQIGQFRQRLAAVIGRQHLALPRIEACLLEMEIGNQQGVFLRPEKRRRSDDFKAMMGEQKGNHEGAMR